MGGTQKTEVSWTAHMEQGMPEKDGAEQRGGKKNHHHIKLFLVGQYQEEYFERNMASR